MRGTVRVRRSVTGHVVVTVGPCAVRVAPRVLFVGAALVACLAAVAVVVLMSGTMTLAPGEVVAALAGQGEEAVVRTVQRRRLPRLLTALLVGGALGVAGAIFQSLSRNSLGSPDFIGFTAGAATGAVVQIVVFGGGVVATAVGAVLGATVTGALVYLLARRDRVVGGVRLVLVGVGVGAVCTSITQLLIIRAELSNAASAQLWLAGSLVGRGWPHVVSLLVALGLLLPVLVWLGRRLTLLEMGDDLAGGLGVAVERTRLAAVGTGVTVTGIAVAAAGPIAFVALAVPQIVARLVRRAGVHLACSFVLGGCLLAVADLLSQRLDIGLRTPVGTVTALLGGLYVIYLLARRV